MGETCRLRRGEEYGACADEGARPAACGGARNMELVPTKEPASHLASRRCPGVLPNASNRAEARTHFYKWNIGMQVRIECENPNLPKFTARYGSI